MPSSMRYAALLVTLFGTAAVRADGPDAAGVEFFEKKIRPVLVEQCYRCHSDQARQAKKLRGGLLLDSRQGGLKGGDTGPAIVPGKAKESLLMKALKHEGDVRMPPKREAAGKGAGRLRPLDRHGGPRSARRQGGTGQAGARPVGRPAILVVSAASPGAAAVRQGCRLGRRTTSTDSSWPSSRRRTCGPFARPTGEHCCGGPISI